MSTTRPKGYHPWRPQQKTQIVLAQVEAVLEEYRPHLPLTARQIFYRIVGAYGYPKTEAAYERLCNYLSRARRARIVPFEALRDDGASVMAHLHHDGEDGFYGYIRRLGKHFEQDKLANQAVNVRVYCEAAGMMPQLRRVLKPYSVPVFSCSGFDSLTAKHDLVRWCHDACFYEGKRPVVLHLGDYDPSGESIFEVIREDALAFLSEDLSHRPRSYFKFQRVALTEEQVEIFDLPTSPPKTPDSRSRRWSGSGTCQLEALPPDTMADILVDEVERWIDLDTLTHDQEAEITARRNIVRALPGGAA